MSSINRVFRGPARLFAGVLRDRNGAVAGLLAIGLSAIVGFAGLGSEVAAWYYTKRAMQGAADSAATTAAAALAAATVSGSSVTGTQLSNAGRRGGSTVNFRDGTGRTTV